MSVVVADESVPDGIANACPTLEPIAGGDEAIRTLVRSIMGSAVTGRNITERRADQRFMYPYLVRLTPLEDHGLSPVGADIVVVGKQLSQRGLDFYHHQPLSYRRVIASLETSRGKYAGLLLELSWCRFIGDGWYDNGGRFRYVVASPLQHIAD